MLISLTPIYIPDHLRWQCDLATALPLLVVPTGYQPALRDAVARGISNFYRLPHRTILPRFGFDRLIHAGEESCNWRNSLAMSGCSGR